MDAERSASTSVRAPSLEDTELSRRVFYLSMVIGSLAVAVAVFSVPYLPTNDGPQHVLSGFLQKEFSEPGTPYSAFLEPLPEFAERGFSVLFEPLLELFSWRTALSTTLSLVTLSGAWAFAALACALAKRRTPWAFLGFALAFPWTFYMGFVPFVVGTNVGLATVAYALRYDEPRRLQLFLLSTLLFVEAVMHVGTSVAFGLVLLLVFLLRAREGQRLRALGTVLLVGAPAAAVLMTVLVAPSRARASGIHEPWIWTPWLERLHQLPRFMLPGPMPRALLGSLLVVVGLATGVRRARNGEASRGELGVLGAALLFVVVSLLGPLDAPGWQLVAPRFACVGAPLAVALLAPLWPTRSPRALLAAILALAGASLGTTYDFHHRLSRACEPALAGLSSPVRLDGFTLPLPLDPYCGVSSDPRVSEVPHLAPLFHVGALYAVARGGFTPYMFGGAASIHAFQYRPDARQKGMPPSPPPSLYVALGRQEVLSDRAKREFIVARFAEYGSTNDHLLVIGASAEDLASILARGYIADWLTASAMIAHPRRCTLDVLVHADDPRGVRVEVGQRPAGESVQAMAAERGEEIADGSRRLTLSGGGCGPLWVRGFRDVDSSGGASKGDVFCAGAGRDGSLNVDVVDRAEVQCRIETRTRPAEP